MQKLRAEQTAQVRGGKEQDVTWCWVAEEKREDVGLGGLGFAAWHKL